MGRCLIVATFGLAVAAAAGPVRSPVRPITDPRSVVSQSDPSARSLPLDVLLDAHEAKDAIWSRDGDSLYASLNETGRFNIWKIGRDKAVQLSVSDDSQSDLALSPDGGTLAYSQDRDGNELYDIYALDIGSRTSRNLTRTPDIAEINARFSPDGSMVAFESKPSDKSVFDISVLDLRSGRIRQLTHEATLRQNWSIVAWDPTGRSLIANRNRIDSQESSIWRIDISDEKNNRPVAAAPGKIVSADDLCSDGFSLALSSNVRTGQLRTGIYDLRTKRTRWVAASPWEQRGIRFSPDCRTLLYRRNTNGRSELILFRRGSGREQMLVSRPGWNNAPSPTGTPFSPDSAKIVFRHSNAGQPQDLWVAAVGDASPERWTSLAPPRVYAANLPGSTLVDYRSFDGTLIGAIVTLPPNLRRDGSNPAVVMPHGGPDEQDLDGFDKMNAALVQAGYIVIRPNIRGSTGYGAPFLKANVGDLGGNDLRDVIAAKDFLVATGYVDPRRVGITGGSYGGFMTLMALGRYPDAFAAGVQHYGILDWASMYETSDPLLRQFIAAVLGDPVRDRDKYVASSPLTYLDRFRAPLLSLQGENDPRVPRQQADQLQQALKARGRVAEKIVYAGEGHGFSRLENEVDSIRRTIDWFDRYLKDRR